MRGDTAPQTVGSNAPPASGASGGTGGGVGGGGGTTPTPSPSPANFLDVSSTATFDVVGSFHAIDKDVNTASQAPAGSLYMGNASTVNTPSGTITFDPRTGIFNLKVADAAAGVSRTINFQDPAHRSAFSPAEYASRQIPELDKFNYLEVFDGSAIPVFFYQRPGTSTTYVSLGGFSRSQQTVNGALTNFKGERGVFVFGQKTIQSQIPITGTGSYTGGFLASMVSDKTGGGSSYLQWINGSSTIAVDFGTRNVALRVEGLVGPAFAQGTTTAPNPISAPANSIFFAKGTAQIDLIRSGGFTGTFLLNQAATGTTAEVRNVGFNRPDGSFLGVDFASVALGGSTAGASSIDGAFYGPGAVNVGGNLRIIGGVPNERVDIMGAFTGAKQP